MGVIRGLVGVVVGNCIALMAAYGSSYGMDKIPESVAISELIFQNECGGRTSSLLTWNVGEAFPSLGIGHFIWYSEGMRGPFTESFPALVRFIETRGVVLPTWFQSLPEGRQAPWRSRGDFYADREAGRLNELQEFLIQTKELQAAFMIERFKQSIPRILDRIAVPERVVVQQKLLLLLHATGGLYPLIDYVNFNGEGLQETERYRGQGWGLLQVLEEMNMPPRATDAIEEFMYAAERILERRVAGAPPERNEQRWLPGWKNRIRTYDVVRRTGETTSDRQMREAFLAMFAEQKQYGPDAYELFAVPSSG